ncbi:aspartic-type endopeptidase (CtsD), putative [Cordyceps militaris CM01]|uniref:Aspartic-type endopeptidase (CtsD), putative n=1 Tax=Cordyceps militaris (strain CM01) TaxID=983644 RepID=G3J729_CORMM|nr:aspartic-type endopeptidase (CtsD), putative [Cordyceps militaris CM01]EGX97102.1 aspartic-type endopeptidase (CtsD), putative [Cordyceps militaris CM01]
MQLVPSLLCLALWSSSALAFYPYRPAWLKSSLESEDKRATLAEDSEGLAFEIHQRQGRPVVSQEAIRLAAKYDSHAALARRKNTYAVTTATTPSTSDAAGINQDGTDYSYFIQVSIGSKGTKLYMLVDTGAGSSWVMGADCSSDACAKHNTFGTGQSDTLTISDKDFSVAYGSGKVSGKLATDTISVAGMSVKYQIGLASTTSTEFKDFAFDGILGLSMGSGASANFLATLTSAAAIKSAIFSVALSRAADGGTSGEIKFGGINSAKYTGDISYTSLASKSGDWAINLDDMSFDGKKAGVGKLAYIDTGTTYIFGPPSVTDKVHAVIDGSKKQGAYYSVPCDTTTPITVTFSGVDYQIPAKDWVGAKDTSGTCFSNIYGQEVVKDSWLIGATFLKNVYTVFDKDGGRIGFAKTASGDSASSVSSSATPSGSSSVFSSLYLSSSSLGPTSNTATPTSSPSTMSTKTSSAGPSASASKPSLGLTGQETTTAAASGSSTVSVADATKTGDKGNGAASGLHAQGAQLASFVGVAALLLIV